MRVICGDYESFFSEDYTLKRLSTEAYIRDPRFEAHGIAVKWSKDHESRWYTRREWEQISKTEDWSDVFMIHHHANFDGLINSHHYGIHPKMYGDTMGMARLLLPAHVSVSLDSLRKQFGFPPKTTPYNLFRGKHWHELTHNEQVLVAEGACDEVASIWKLFGLLGKDFPKEEYLVLSETAKMFVEPVLRADVDLLGKVWEKEENEKHARLVDLGVTAADLQSADKFTALLRQEGIEPAQKAGKNGPIPAFSKTDPFMEELLEYDNPRVRTLAEARLGEKSTFLQTRAATLGWMASRGPLCVYLRYAGAGTLRVAGGDKCNWLNFKRRSDIRRSVLAPKGSLLGPVDASQIECRVLHYLAGGPDEPVIRKFRAGEDPYTGLASKFYKETIYKPKQSDPRYDEMDKKRGMGKVGRLMCGYGASGKAFKIAAHNGLYGPPCEISIEDANAFVALYREDNPSICAKNTGYWAQASRMLARLAGGDPVQWGPLTVKNKRIYLPNGCPLIYDSLEYHVPADDEDCKEFERGGYWRVQVGKRAQGRRDKEGRFWKTIWGSKLVQNICEAVSRVIVSQAMIRCANLGYRALNWPYDELLFLIPDDGHAEEHLERCRLEMVREVPWLPGLPLDAEASLGERYSK